MAENETEKAFSSNPFKGKETVKRLKNVARNVPILGTAFDVADIASSVATGNLGKAAIDTGLALAGTTPVGRVLSKGAKFIAKEFRKKDIEEAEKLINNTDAKKQWEKENKVKQKQKRVPEVQEAAEKLSEGKITSGEYRRTVKAYQPIKPITDKNFPELPTLTQIVGSLNKDKVEKGIVGINKSIPDGTRVGSRLDIPAYENYDTWVVSLHDGTKQGGAVLGYGQTAVLKNVEFKTAAKGGLRIAKGADKTTIARIHGDYYNANPEDVYELSKELLNNPEWTQVGMNPFRHSYFYNKTTGQPVLEADEVIQVGPLVLAKGVKTPSISDLKSLKVKTLDKKIRMFNEGGTAMKEQMEMAFMQDGGLQDEGGTIDKESGNEVPSGSLKKEVRDDIPAMLSEGEFVFPADVVRFIGLNKLMQMRQEAKMGLKLMEKMGQMGNSEEAEIPDDLPFGVTDIIVVEGDKKEKKDDKKEMSEGGVLTASNGTDVVNPRDPNKLYSVEYVDNQGNVTFVQEDYLGRPITNQLQIQTGQLKRKFPFNPALQTETVEPEEEIQNQTQPVKKGRRIQDEFTRLEEQREMNEKALQTSALRVFPVGTTVDGKKINSEQEAIDMYSNLTIGQRLSLVPRELSVITGRDVNTEDINIALNEPRQNPIKTFISNLINGILSPFGITTNDTINKEIINDSKNQVEVDSASSNSGKNENTIPTMTGQNIMSPVSVPTMTGQNIMSPVPVPTMTGQNIMSPPRAELVGDNITFKKLKEEGMGVAQPSYESTEPLGPESIGVVQPSYVSKGPPPLSASQVVLEKIKNISNIIPTDFVTKDRFVTKDFFGTKGPSMSSRKQGSIIPTMTGKNVMSPDFLERKLKPSPVPEAEQNIPEPPKKSRKKNTQEKLQKQIDRIKNRAGATQVRARRDIDKDTGKRETQAQAQSRVDKEADRVTRALTSSAKRGTLGGLKRGGLMKRKY